MQKIEVTKRIADTGAMAIVRVKTVERGFEIAQGCLDGGIDCLEISYTLPNAGEVIAALREKYGDKLVVGAVLFWMLRLQDMQSWLVHSSSLLRT